MIGVKLVAIIAAVVVTAVGGWGFKNYAQLKNKEQQLIEKQEQLDIANASLERALGVNQVNQSTIEELQRDKAAIEASVKSLQDDRRRTQQVLNNMSAAIRAQASDPANQVALSPVLKSTVDAIQKQRAEREGAAK